MRHTLPKRLSSVTTITWVAALLALSSCDPPPQVPGPMLVADPPPTEDGRIPGAGMSDYDRGVEYIKQGDWKQAIVHLDQALKLGPNNAKAEYYRAVAKEQLADLPSAELGYKRALELDPELVDAAINLGALYLQDPVRPTDAVKVLSIAVRKDPGAADAKQNLAYAYGMLEQWDKAAEQYKATIALKDSPELRFAYGEALVRLGQKKEAAPHLYQALQAYRKEVPNVIEIAEVLSHAGAAKECIEAWDIVLEAKPDIPTFYVRRGACKHMLSDEGEARKDFQKAIKLDSNYAPAYLHLGKSYKATKSIKLAEDALKTAVRLGKDTPIAEQAKKVLKDMAEGK